MEKEMHFDKPFKTYEEMMEILKSRNVIITDPEFAREALQNFSYYGLVNGYKNTFLLQPGTDDQFQSGTKFEELYTLHMLDTSLNSVLFKYILYLEKALKSRLSYLIAENYGVFTDKNDSHCKNKNDYLCQSNYSNSSGRRINILRSLKQCISQDRNNPMLLHYLQHRNHIPPWILTTNISYGLTIEWYNILKGADKDSICDSFISPGLLSKEETKEFIRKSFDLTKEYRNKIAHGNRTFSIIGLPQLPKHQLLTLTYHLISEDEYDHKIGQNDTLAVLLSTALMLRDPYIVANLIAEVQNVLLPYSTTEFNGNTIYKLLGFPDDLFSRLNNFAKRKYSQ